MRSILASALIVSAVAALGAQKMERPGIVNFTKVDAVVACGGATETAALEGLKNDGFKAVINLRLPTEQGANLEENAAKAKSLGLNYISLPLNGQSPRSEGRRRLPRGRRQQGQSAGVHPLRIGRTGRRGVDGEARAAGRLDGRQSGRRGPDDRPAERTAREVRAARTSRRTRSRSQPTGAAGAKEPAGLTASGGGRYC